MRSLERWLVYLLVLSYMAASFVFDKVYGAEVTLGCGIMTERYSGTDGYYLTRHTTLLDIQRELSGEVYWGFRHTSQTVEKDEDTGENTLYLAYKVGVTPGTKLQLALGFSSWGMEVAGIKRYPAAFVSWQGKDIGGVRPELMIYSSYYYRGSYHGVVTFTTVYVGLGHRFTL